MSARVPALRLVRCRVLRPTFPSHPLIPLIISRGCSTATAGRRVVARAAVRDVLVLHGSTRALVNLLPANLTGELLAALGYAALLAKNLMLTEAPRRLLPLLAFTILAVATVTSPVLASFVSFTDTFRFGYTVM